MQSDYFEVRETKRRQSDTIASFAAALVEAQKKIINPKKASDNPFFKSKYADLAACADACREHLTDNGIAVMAFPSLEGNIVSVETLLLHKSGEWMSSTVSAEARKGKRDEGSLPDNGAQSVSAAITYLRRAGLTSMVFITPEDEDDDGNRAEGRDVRRTSKPEVSRHTTMASVFRAIGVSISDLETRLKHTIDKTSDEEFEELEGVYRQIKAGKPIGEFFDVPVRPETAAPQATAVVEKPPVNHEPAKAGNEPRPGEKKGRGRPAKKEEPPAKTAPVVPDDIPVEDPPDDSSTTKTEEAPATAEEKKAIYPKLKGYSAVAGLDPLKSYVMKTNNVSDTSKLTKKQWDVTIAALEAAHKEGPEALKKLVSG